MLWNKVMKEVKAKRYAGPFTKIPFDHYIQSPIGLVPKDGGKDMRLIFHLSHPRNKSKGFSVNACMPKELCSVTYPGLEEAIRLCMQMGRSCKISKSDMKSAFRNLGILKNHWKYLVMMVESPLDSKIYYFVDKCLPFGAAISCLHFQHFSNVISHIVKIKSGGKPNINYLDDFLFVALLKYLCDSQVQLFLDICQTINFPVSLEKMYWSIEVLTFLGLLIDTISLTVSITKEKLTRL